MRVLVTGDGGYIGTVLVPVFASAGHQVTGIDSDFYRDCSLPSATNEEAGRSTRYRPLRRHKDVRDLTRQDFDGFDAVVHLAALSNDALGDLKPEWTYEINHRASVRMAELARAAGVSRFVYASSCSVYGAAGDMPVDESSPLAPVTPYAESKVRTEADLLALGNDSFSPIFMRNATAFGVSRQFRADLVLNNFVCWAVTTGEIRLQSDGTPWRPLVHIEDIARAALALLEAPAAVVHGQAFNVGCDADNYRVGDLADIVRQTVSGCRVTHAPGAGPDARTYRVSFAKLSALVPAFRPRWTVTDGAREICDAVVAAGLTAADVTGGRYSRIAQLKRLIASSRLDDTLRWAAVHA
jgi:nucleoside-diphosphate-sugar epimerase